MLIPLVRLLAASLVGSMLGVVVAIMVVCGFAAMILNSILNIYYASLYFLVGALYTYRIFRKSQVSLLNEGGEGKRNQDRFLKGGKEQ